MNIIQPSRLTFWRSVFALTAALSFLSVIQILRSGTKLGVDFSVSRAWMGVVSLLGLLGLLSLTFFALTWSRYREPLLSFAEFPEQRSKALRWISLPVLALAIAGYSLVSMLPFFQEFFSSLGWARFLVFWIFSFVGLWGIKWFRRDTPWFIALIAIVLCQSTLHLLLVYWPRVTDYPFAMGWSETSRYYYPSLFLSDKVYRREYPWPILHPTLHLLLAPPYLFDAPLWVHRAWQVGVRYVLVAAVVPALMSRLSVQGRPTRWLAGLWMFLFLFMGPIYFNLTIPVIILLLGYLRPPIKKINRLRNVGVPDRLGRISVMLGITFP